MNPLYEPVGQYSLDVGEPEDYHKVASVMYEEIESSRTLKRFDNFESYLENFEEFCQQADQIIAIKYNDEIIGGIFLLESISLHFQQTVIDWQMVIKPEHQGKHSLGRKFRDILKALKGADLIVALHKHNANGTLTTRYI